MTTNGVITALASLNNTNGEYCFSGLIIGSDGNLYGLAELGGASGYGTIFQFSTSLVLSNIYSFLYSSNCNCFPGGFEPYSPLVLGMDGNYYGTTEAGGTNGGYGTIFRLSITPPAPMIQSVKLMANAIQFAWSAVSGQRFQVQYKTNLTQAGWNDLGGTITATGSTAFAVTPQIRADFTGS